MGPNLKPLSPLVMQLPFVVDPEGAFASSEVLARVDTNPYGKFVFRARSGTN